MIWCWLNRDDYLELVQLFVIYLGTDYLLFFKSSWDQQSKIDLTFFIFLETCRVEHTNTISEHCYWSTFTKTKTFHQFLLFYLYFMVDYISCSIRSSNKWFNFIPQVFAYVNEICPSIALDALSFVEYLTGEHVSLRLFSAKLSPQQKDIVSKIAHHQK